MSDAEVLIKAQEVSKKFCRTLKRSLWYGMQDVYMELSGRRSDTHKLRKNEFWALENVSFELRRGECLGLIGKNGAGKSTLLKLLNGIIKLDSGRIEMHGRVGALIELGAGFNPILSGLENIYINGSILGFTKKEIDKKLDSIIEFSEIDDFIDMPVKNYSSGMKLRLGFAVAANMEPDILLIDEVLAVGDMGFIMKCLNAVDNIMKNAAVIFVSHNMPFVSRICSQLMILEKGKIVFDGVEIASGIDMYFSKFGSSVATFTGSGKAEVLDVRFSTPNNNQNNLHPFIINYLDDFQIEIDLKVAPQYKFPTINLIFYDKQVRGVAECFMINGNCRVTNKDGFISLRITIPRFNLTQGIYTLTIVIRDNIGKETLLRHQSIKGFQVSAPFIGFAPTQFKGCWEQLN